MLLRTVSLGHAGTGFAPRSGKDDPSGAPGLAALSICESMLLSMTDTGVIDDDEAKAILEDAATRAPQRGRCVGWLWRGSSSGGRDHRGDHHRRQLGAPSPKRHGGAVHPLPMVRATVYEDCTGGAPLRSGATPPLRRHREDRGPSYRRLVELGHDVVLFASADARTKARLVPVRDQAIRLDPHPLKSDLAAHLSMLHELHRRADEFDILHFHVDLIHFPFFEELAQPDRDRCTAGSTSRTWPRPTGAGRTTLGLDLGRPERPLPWRTGSPPSPTACGRASIGFTPEPADGGYLAFLGRISPEKRPDRAIAIAKRTGLRLKIAAKVDAVDRAYFAKRSSPCSAIP